MTARGCTEKQERASPSDAEGGARIFAEEKREMGHLLCFYLLELGMAAAWCRWVICREVDLPALLRTARTVWSGERQVLGELLLVRRRWTEGEETERFRQAWRRIALRLLPPLLYLTLGGALAPVLAWRMFPEGAGQLAMGCCVLAGLLLGGIAQAAGAAGTEGAAGELRRPGYGQEEYTRQVMVKGLFEEEVPVEIRLAGREYRADEIHRVYQQVLEELPERIRGGNLSLNQVRSDLKLISRMDEYGITLRWESENCELVDSFGAVNAQDVPEGGAEVELRVELTDGRCPEQYVLPVRVVPQRTGARETTALWI